MWLIASVCTERRNLLFNQNVQVMCFSNLLQYDSIFLFAWGQIHTLKMCIGDFLWKYNLKIILHVYFCFALCVCVSVIIHPSLAKKKIISSYYVVLLWKITKWQPTLFLHPRQNKASIVVLEFIHLKCINLEF